MATVLIVEDNPPLRKIYETLLTREGYGVDSAVDGKEALDKALSTPPDLILLDMMMPVLDGVGFLRAFDVMSKHPEVKVIVFSNTEMPEKVNEAMQLGASKYMMKHSVTPKAMVALVRETLRQAS